MLTSALRSGGLATTSVAEATPSRSPGVSSTAFHAQPPNLRFAPLMDMDFAVRCPLVRRWRLVSGFCPSTRTFVPCFLQTPPRGGSPCIITRPYLHQVGQRTFTSRLLSMPSTQRSRGTADACVIGVNYSFPWTTTISPYQRHLPPSLSTTIERKANIL